MSVYCLPVFCERKYALALISQAVEELLVELDLDKKSVLLGTSRVSRYFNCINFTQKRTLTQMTHLVSVTCLRYLWSEMCCDTWSSRGTSRSRAGWCTYRLLAWDIWPVRDTENSKWVNLPLICYHFDLLAAECYVCLHSQVQQMAVSCLQRNLRALRAVSKWSWWKLFCKLRPLLDVNMDNERLRAKEVHSHQVNAF